MNYSQYKLTSTSEIEAYQTKAGERFTIFMNAVYNVLMKMNAGDEYHFTRHVKEENREMFVKTACLFMSEQREQDFTFNESYTIIKRDFPLILKQHNNEQHND